MTQNKDGDWHNGMYNNRALVPEHPEHLRRWGSASADAMRSLHRELDVRYGGGPNEHLDIFPAAQAHAPVLVFIHGGYWRSLDKRDHSFVAPPFVEKGVCVVIPNYALAPAVTIPRIVMQMVQAVAWTWRHIARYGGDPGRITVAGHSAGGQLAAMMLSCLWSVYGRDLPRDVVKSALSISGLHDLDPIMRSPFLQSTLHLTREQVQMTSPALLPAPARGTLYTVCGAGESIEYHRQNQLIRDAWGAKRVPVCEMVAGRNHFTVLDALVETEHRLHGLACELIAGDTALGRVEAFRLYPLGN